MIGITKADIQTRLNDYFNRCFTPSGDFRPNVERQLRKINNIQNRLDLLDDSDQSKLDKMYNFLQSQLAS